VKKKALSEGSLRFILQIAGRSFAILTVTPALIDGQIPVAPFPKRLVNAGRLSAPDSKMLLRARFRIATRELQATARRYAVPRLFEDLARATSNLLCSSAPGLTRQPQSPAQILIR
jgi:hypothetical protein